MRAALLAACLASLAAPALACGPETDCTVANGTYRLHLPKGDPTGAILFAHGYRGNAGQAMGNEALMAMADRLGVAFVALDSGADDWALPDAPSGDGARRDETAYALSVRDDVAARTGIAAERTILTGFSAGGMFVWNVACEAGDGFAAYVAMSGTFWDGPPEACAGGARITHIHGTSDAVVPIAGRAIGPTRQGDVEAVLAMYRADRGLGAGVPSDFAGLDCTEWDGDAMLRYCTHPGGHRFDADWLAAAWNDSFPDG